MAYVSPSNRTTGDVLTAAQWNQDVRSNQQAMAPDIFTTAGDLVYATAADTAARLAIGTANQGLRVNSGVTAPEWAAAPTISLDRDVTETEVVNTTTETTVYSYSVPANTLGTNKLLRLTLIGDYLNNSGTDKTLTLKITYGATSLLNQAFTFIATSASRRAIPLESWLSANNATNSQRSLTRLWIFGGGSAGSPPSLQAISHRGLAVHNAVAEDSTAAKTLAVTVTHNNADTTISFRAFDTQLELI